MDFGQRNDGKNTYALEPKEENRYENGILGAFERLLRALRWEIGGVALKFDIWRFQEIFRS